MADSSASTIKTIFLDVLYEEIGLPVMLQGSLSETEEYPQEFFTYWNNTTSDNNHYDNEPVSWTWSFDLNCYSTSPERVGFLLERATAALKEHGFIIVGKGYDVYSDEITHTGRGINVLYIENNRR